MVKSMLQTVKTSAAYFFVFLKMNTVSFKYFMIK